MSELQHFLQESSNELNSEISGFAQARMIVPVGTVRNVSRNFENRISIHRYEQDQVYINRASQNMYRLRRQNRTYAEQLRLAENVTLFNLPTHLVDFLRDHDNLYRAASRSRLTAKKAIASPHMDVLVQVLYRLQNIRTVYYVNMIEESHSHTERLRLMHDPLFQKEFNDCTKSLQNEIIHQLIRFEQLLSSLTKDMELENVGPDHNIDKYGHEIPSMVLKSALDDRDLSIRCCICLEPYTITHTAFLTNNCGHTIGKSCLSQWLNSTSKNANLCPHCRTPLCERRARRPAGMTPATLTEQREISDRLARAIIMIGDVEKLHDELFGTDMAVTYVKRAMDDLNYRLFENDIGFCLGYEGTMAFRWGIRRVNWH